jgi:hypothetical protein
MEYSYAPTESSNWSKLGQYQINSPFNGISHRFSLQIARNQVSTEVEADGMALLTS